MIYHISLALNDADFWSLNDFQIPFLWIDIFVNDNFFNLILFVVAQANKDVPLPADTENAEREHLCLQVRKNSFNTRFFNKNVLMQGTKLKVYAYLTI